MFYTIYNLFNKIKSNLFKKMDKYCNNSDTYNIRIPINDTPRCPV